MNLNLGCGNRPFKKTINCDIRKIKFKNFVMADARNLPFKKNIFDNIWLLDVLEHFSNVDAIKVISQLRIVVKNKIYIQVPNLETIAKMISNEENNITVLIEKIYGGQEYNENLHKYGYTPYTIYLLLARLFTATNIKIIPIFDYYYKTTHWDKEHVWPNNTNMMVEVTV